MNKTNSAIKNYTYQKGTNTQKVNSRMLAQKKGHANPSNAHSVRANSTTKNQVSSKSGLKGLSIGQRVPMKMFDESYLDGPQSVMDGMQKHQEANDFKKAAKKALKGKQKKFFNL